MKILICSIYLPYENDGVSSSTKQLVNALEQKGVDVSIFTTDWGWNSDDILKYKSDKFRIFKSNLNNNFDFSIEMIKSFFTQLKYFDLVHFNSLYSFSTVLGGHIAKKNNIPYVVSPRGNFVPPSLDRRGYRSIWKKRLFFKFLTKRVLLSAEKIICTSDKEKESVLRQINAKNVTYINNGLDFSQYPCRISDHDIIEKSLGIDKNRPVFIFLGRISKEKAIPFLLDVWERASQKIPGSVLVIMGGGDSKLTNKIKEKIKLLTIPESVVMPGPISGELKHALLMKSRCLFFPSYFESFGNVVLESLISGTPVIASKGTPWSILEEERLGRWLPWDESAWVKAILDIFENDKYQSKEFFARSRNWVIENFNWADIAAQYIDMYQEVIKSRKKL
jgi:glycosyltransferase involved in cell wall biosynthesis